jgi:hypothetical protein
MPALPASHREIRETAKISPTMNMGNSVPTACDMFGIARLNRGVTSVPSPLSPPLDRPIRKPTLATINANKTGAGIGLGIKNDFDRIDSV